MADAFDVLGRLMLPSSSPEGWTATLVTDLARGDKTLEAAVKLGKYVLHPTFLALANDATRVLAEALHTINVSRLQALADSVREPSVGLKLPKTRPATTQIGGAPRESLRGPVGNNVPDAVSVFAEPDEVEPRKFSSPAEGEPGPAFRAPRRGRSV
ncbi:hypothetical protein ACYF6T_44470 [Streptomyces sp. 7R007]